MPFGTYEGLEPDEPQAHEHKANGAAGKAVLPYRLEGPADFRTIRKPRFVVPGLAPQGGTFLLFAPSGHYKTTVALLLLVMAANGRALDGTEIEPTPLIVVANEDAHGVKLRLLAVAQQHGVSLDDVRVLGSDERFNLDMPEDRDRLVAAAGQAFGGRRPALLVDHYDVSVTLDPTDPKTGGVARDALRDLVARGFACAGLLAHTPWTTTDRAKLPVSLWANMDARMRLHKRDDGSAELFVEHVKNAESGFALEVRLGKVTVELEDGPCETVAAEFATDATGALHRGRKARDRQDLSSDQKTAVKAVARAVAEQPAPKPAGTDIPDKVVGTSEKAAIDTIARLLPTTTRTGSERKGNKQREHAARVLHSLHGRYLVRMVDGFVWLAKAAEAEASQTSQSSQTPTLRRCDTRPETVATSQTPFRGVAMRCDGAVSGTGDESDPPVEDEFATPEPLVLADGLDGPEVTAVFSDCYGQPLVRRGRLTGLRVDSWLNGTRPVRSVELSVQEARGRRRGPTQSFSRELPDPVLVLEGSDAEVRCAVDPNRPRVLLHDGAAFRGVWEDIARQAQATGRRVIFDSIAEAIAHREHREGASR